MRRLWKLPAVAVGVAACFTFGLQGTASAAHPSGCSDGLYDNGWHVVCKKSNGGKYRAWVRCIPFNGGPKVERDAAIWKSKGQSIVNCPPLTYVETGGKWTRG